MSKEDGRKEREARSLALERAYVHDVYDQISNQFSHSVYRAWPRVTQFLETLEPGSLVADIGCGNGKYLKVNTKTFSIGVDRCSSLANRAQENGSQVMLSDNTCLPFRDNGFDACISIAVIHHFATTERRVCALRELARILKIGGRLMITVWAMEQSQRKFESQDVLVPWHRPSISLTDETSSNIDRDHNSVTPEEDSRIYRTYLPSVHSCCSPKYEKRKSSRRRRKSRGDSEDSSDDSAYAEFLLPGLGSYSPQGSEVTSPKESCYSFVRRALQKLTSSRRGSNGKSWLTATKGLNSLSTCNEEYIIDTIKNAERRFNLANGIHTDSHDNIDDVPIELRQLEPDDPNLLDIPPTSVHPINANAKCNSKSVSLSDCERDNSKSMSLSDCERDNSKSMSLSDCERDNSASPAILSENMFSLLGSRNLIDSESSTAESISNVMRSKSSSSCLSLSSRTNISSPISASGLSVLSSDSAKGHDSRSNDSGVDEESFRIGRKRPTLRKQKASINETEAVIVIENNKIKKTTEPNSVPIDYKDVDCVIVPKPSIIKQSSLNDEIIYIDRYIENEKIKQRVQKQCSLNEDLIYGNTDNKEMPFRQRLFRSQYKHFQAIRDRLHKIRVASLDRFENESTESFRTGILKLLQSWKSELIIPEYRESGSNHRRTSSASSDFLESINRGKLYFESKFKSSSTNPAAENSALDSDKCEDENKTLFKRELSERKSSREESSDSSKENSLQSDTSLDSEDSCISVIFVPRPDQNIAFLNEKERNRSVSSESSDGSDKPNSPKSPKSPKSPSNNNSRYFTGSKLLCKKTSKSSMLRRNETPNVDSTINSLAYAESAKVKIVNSNLPLENQNVIVPKIENDSNLLQVSRNTSLTEFTLDSNTRKNTVLSKPKLNTHIGGTNVITKSQYLDEKNPNLILKNVLPNKITLKENEFKHDNSTYKNSAQTVNKKISNNNAGTNKNQQVKKTMPKYLTFEVFNPETDDLDSDSSSSSSPQSGSSVIEMGWPTAKEIEDLDKEIKRKEEEERHKQQLSEFHGDQYLAHEEIPKLSLVEPVHRMDTINEETNNSEINPYHSIIRRMHPDIHQHSKDCHSVTKKLENITPVIGKIESLKVKQSETSSSTKPGIDTPRTAQSPVKAGIPKASGPSSSINVFNSAPIMSEIHKDVGTTAKLDYSKIGDFSSIKKGISHGFQRPNYNDYIHQTRNPVGDNSQENKKAEIVNLPPDASGYSNTSSECITLRNNFLSSYSNQPQNYSKELLALRSIATRKGISKDSEPSEGCSLPGSGQQLAKRDKSEMCVNINQIGENALKAQVDKTVNTMERHCSTIPSQYVTKTIHSKSCDVPSIPYKPVLKSDKQHSSSIDYEFNINRNIVQMTKRTDTSFKEKKQPNQRAPCENCRKLQENALRSIVNEWQDPTVRKISEKTSAERRKTLRQQSSLDSAQERRDFYCRGRMKLSRSGSLDLSSSSRSTKSLSKDDSLSTSQDSLQSDIGGAPTLHRYYHVFREGELDQIIEKYVHNLHIISSYYDHANWCIIAEKVQVWTI